MAELNWTAEAERWLQEIYERVGRNKRSALRRIYWWSTVLIRKTTAVTIQRVTASPNPPYYSLDAFLSSDEHVAALKGAWGVGKTHFRDAYIDRKIKKSCPKADCV